ncbi:hypothetical protein LSAT2_028778 [Lamellibrachia satsuma]|nr:hypothetical protein LSAT2_028778 [Lamellibrachia satsuma]
MSILIQLRAPMPVTITEIESLFSKLERMLTTIHSTMDEKRLETLLIPQVQRAHTPYETPARSEGSSKKMLRTSLDGSTVNGNTAIRDSLLLLSDRVTEAPELFSRM